MSHVVVEHHRALLQKWFQLDANASSPIYKLLPIPVHLPDFLNQVRQSGAAEN